MFFLWLISETLRTHPGCTPAPLHKLSGFSVTFILSFLIPSFSFYLSVSFTHVLWRNRTLSSRQNVFCFATNPLSSGTTYRIMYFLISNQLLHTLAIFLTYTLPKLASSKQDVVHRHKKVFPMETLKTHPWWNLAPKGKSF